MSTELKFDECPKFYIVQKGTSFQTRYIEHRKKFGKPTHTLLKSWKLNTTVQFEIHKVQTITNEYTKQSTTI